MSSDPPVAIKPESAAQPAGPPPAVEAPTYGQILKSSALIGGSSLLNIAIGIGRTKAMAVLLGPGGFGLLSLFWSIADLAVSVAGMGVNMSGVRQIAEAAGSGDQVRISRTVTVLRRTSLLLGISGALLLLASSIPVARMTFGNDQHAASVACLSLAVLFRLLSDSQAAVLQGMRRIADLAKIGPIGILLGAITAVAVVSLLGERAVAVVVIANAAMGLLVSWWFAKRVRLEPPPMSRTQVRDEALALLKLGSVFMASNLLTIGAAYLVRIIVLRHSGLEAAGLYQSAYALGSMYIGILLQAMGADFYPRLVAVSDRDGECNRLVNEQTRVSLLLAGPGVTATLAMAPILITVFYSPRFAAAVGALEWICIGMALRVISWPMGTVMLAKNTRALFFWSELTWTVVGVTLAWAFVSRYGLDGAGMAFFGAQVFHVAMNYPIVRHLSGFRWTAENRSTGTLFLLLLAAVFCAVKALPPGTATAVALVGTLLSCGYSIRALVRLINLESMPGPLRALLVRLRIARAQHN